MISGRNSCREIFEPSAVMPASSLKSAGEHYLLNQGEHMGKHQSLGLAVLRIVVGIIFLAHGYMKLFKMGFHGVAGMFGHMGIPIPVVFAVIVTLVEFVGGILLITGLATRIPAALLAIDMIMAILLVHAKNGFFNPGGFEFPLVLLAAAICLVLAGGGAASLDKL
jgi:putative oxidoreductase